MRSSVDLHESGCVRVIDLTGDIRNDITEIQNIFWVQAFPVPLVIPSLYTEERILFQNMYYPTALELCNNRNINCVWFSMLNAYDISIIQKEKTVARGWDVLHFEDKKSAMMFKLVAE